MVYGALFGTGSLLYGHPKTATFWIITGALGTAGLLRMWPKLWGARSLAPG
jgi:hypothetical protein